MYCCKNTNTEAWKCTSAIMEDSPEIWKFKKPFPEEEARVLLKTKKDLMHAFFKKQLFG